MEQNFSLIYQTSFENDSFLELQKYCTELTTKRPDKIFQSPNFSSIPEKLLVSVIQNDNLQMSVVQIWERVLKWGHAQNPELSSDPTSLSKEDFNTLKNTLQQIIPLIKFYSLTSKEFTEKVLPYKKILPKELYKDLLKKFLLSDADSNLKNCDSKIISAQHAELISKWIDRLEFNDNIKNPPEFKLLFRGSRDGFTTNKFHETCDGQLRTVTIVKVKDSNEILGGYNPKAWAWDSVENDGFGYYSTTKDSFIFSFKKNDRIENYVLSRVIDKKKAVYNGNRNYGPSFGENDLDIWRWENECLCKKYSYENPIRETNDRFFIEECEVFQIVNG